MEADKSGANSDYAHIESVLQQLQDGREQLEDLWATRKLKLDLCLQLRMFEREALEVRSRSMWPSFHWMLHAVGYDGNRENTIGSY